MATISLADLVAGARQRSDQENSTLCSETEVEDYIKQAHADLYDTLVQDHLGLFERRSTLMTTAGSDVVSLSSIPMYKLLGVDVLWGGKYYPLKRYNQDERAVMEHQSGWAGPGQVQYRMSFDFSSDEYVGSGWNLRFIPTPSAEHTLRVIYVPLAPTLADSGDFVSVFPFFNWSEFLMLEAAIRMLEKEESSTTTLEQRKAVLMERMRNHIRTPDAGQGETIPQDRHFSGVHEDTPWWRG